MDNFRSDRTKSWSVYTSANLTPSQAAGDTDPPWKNFGTPLNAISCGFLATAILISLFLILAIFEHLLRPRSSFPSVHDVAERNLESGHMRSRIHLFEKLGNRHTVSSLVMILIVHLCVLNFYYNLPTPFSPPSVDVKYKNSSVQKEKEGLGELRP